MEILICALIFAALLCIITACFAATCFAEDDPMRLRRPE